MIKYEVCQSIKNGFKDNYNNAKHNLKKLLINFFNAPEVEEALNKSAWRRLFELWINNRTYHDIYNAEPLAHFLHDICGIAFENDMTQEDLEWLMNTGDGLRLSLYQE